MNKKLVIYLILGIILVGLVSAQYSYDRPSYGRPSLAFDAISDFYFNYADWIDFFLLLVAFLIIVSKSIGDKFEEYGGKLLVIGISLALTIAFYLWLRRTGDNLLEWITRTPLVFLFVAIVLLYIAYSLIGKLHDKSKWVSITLAYSVVYGFFRVFLGDQFEITLEEYFGYFLIFGIPLVDILYYLAIFCLVIGLIGLFFAKSESGLGLGKLK